MTILSSLGEISAPNIMEGAAQKSTLLKTLPQQTRFGNEGIKTTIRGLQLERFKEFVREKHERDRSRL